MSVKQVLSAVIRDKRGRVLSIGKNSYVKTHPLQAQHARKVGMEHKIYLHAEVQAIIRCPDISKAHKIEIFRFNNKGEPMLAKPCPICDSAIKAAGIKVVVHT